MPGGVRVKLSTTRSLAPAAWVGPGLVRALRRVGRRPRLQSANGRSAAGTAHGHHAQRHDTAAGCPGPPSCLGCQPQVRCAGATPLPGTPHLLCWCNTRGTPHLLPGTPLHWVPPRLRPAHAHLAQTCPAAPAGAAHTPPPPPPSWSPPAGRAPTARTALPSSAPRHLRGGTRRAAGERQGCGAHTCTRIRRPWSDGRQRRAGQAGWPGRGMGSPAAAGAPALQRRSPPPRRRPCLPVRLVSTVVCQ